METSFDQFWNLYDKKTSREKAEKKWYSLSAKDQVAIMEHIPKYKKQQPDRQFRKDPCTYMNQKSWNDEIYGKDGETILHKHGKAQVVSTYQPETFDSDNHKHMRETLKKNFEHGVFIKDYGDLYTTTLTQRLGMVIPEEVSTNITQEVERRANIKPSNRFEEFTEINVPSEIRDLKLKYWLDVQRTKGRELWKEL